jgi:Tol biopolymer transport system component
LSGLPVCAQQLPLPAGHTLLITSVQTGDTEVFAVDPVSGTSVNLTNAPRSEERYPAWSPDGKKIAFSGQDGSYAEIFVCNADGSDLTQLTGLKKISSNLLPWAGRKYFRSSKKKCPSPVPDRCG